MKLIILTKAYNGSKVYVNPEHISMISANDNYESVVKLIGDESTYLAVKESPDSIVKLIELGWK